MTDDRIEEARRRIAIPDDGVDYQYTELRGLLVELLEAFALERARVEALIHLAYYACGCDAPGQPYERSDWTEQQCRQHHQQRCPLHPSWRPTP